MAVVVVVVVVVVVAVVVVVCMFSWGRRGFESSGWWHGIPAVATSAGENPKLEPRGAGQRQG
jgi:hypothetical protein